MSKLRKNLFARKAAERPTVLMLRCILMLRTSMLTPNPQK